MLGFHRMEQGRQNRYARARKAALRLTDILVKQYRARRVVLIGSLADAKRFGLHSDIDLAVEGLEGDRYLIALGELLESAEDFDVDLVPVENATPGMKTKISHGEVLYE